MANQTQQIRFGLISLGYIQTGETERYSVFTHPDSVRRAYVNGQGHLMVGRKLSLAIGLDDHAKAQIRSLYLQADEDTRKEILDLDDWEEGDGDFEMLDRAVVWQDETA